jgi:small neutral amino acid transporter SnatA (MarC family)
MLSNQRLLNGLRKKAALIDRLSGLILVALAGKIILSA